VLKILWILKVGMILMVDNFFTPVERVMVDVVLFAML